MKIKSALILGGADCVWEDMEAAQALGTFDATIAINDVLAYYDGPIDYAVSLHPQKYVIWMKERDRKDFQKPDCFVAFAGYPEAGCYPIDLVIDYKWPGMGTSGSSGLFAIKLAIDRGFTKIVLCGIPMTPAPHFFDGKEWGQVEQFWPTWKLMINHFSDQTRSMSGRTMELLGTPTRQWMEVPDGH